MKRKREEIVESEESGDVHVRFFTRSYPLVTSDEVFAVSSQLTRTSLSQILNSILQTSAPVQFHFAVNGTALHSSISSHIERFPETISREDTIPIEYFSTEQEASTNLNEWISTLEFCEYNSHLRIAGGMTNGDVFLSTSSTPFSILHEEKSAHSQSVNAIVQSDKYLLTGGVDRVIKKWEICVNEENEEVLKCKQEESFVGHEGTVTCLAVDGNKLASCSWDGNVKLWDVDRSEKCYATLTGHDSVVSSLKWVSNSTLLSGSYDHSLRLWDTQHAEESSRLTSRCAVLDVTFLPLRNSIISSHTDGFLRVWDENVRIPVQTLGEHSHPFVSAVVGVDDCLVVSSCYDGLLRIWDLRSGSDECLAVLPHGDGKVLCLSSHERNVCSGGSDGRIVVHSL